MPKALEIPALTKAQARKLTDRIARDMTSVGTLILQAREGKAWEALGYESWESYVQAELMMSVGQSYRILDQERVVGELAAAAGIPASEVSRARDSSTRGGALTQRAAADLKDQLPAVAAKVREVTKGVPKAQRAAKVAEVVDHARGVRPARVKAPGNPPINAAPIPAAAVEVTNPTSAAALIDALVNTRPAEARDIPAPVWRKLTSWVAQAQAVRTPALAKAATRRDVTPNFRGGKS